MWNCPLSVCLRVGFFDVNVFELDLWVQINSVKWPIKRNSVVRDTCLIVGLLPLMIILITASLSSKCTALHLEKTARLKTTWSTLDNSRSSYWIWVFVWQLVCFLDVLLRSKSPCTVPVDFLVSLKEECKTSRAKSQRSIAGIPSMRKPASREIISDSVELCETEVCFLHIQLMGTNVWLPKIHRILPEVDFEWSGSPAKSESWNSSSLHCCATRQHCLKSLVWCF